MANKVSSFSDLIQRVAASCLLHPLAASRHENGKFNAGNGEEGDYESEDDSDEEEEEEEGKDGFKFWEEKEAKEVKVEKVKEMEMLMAEVFDAVSTMKRAYVSLQEAHCPWDPEKMRIADVAVVAELRKIGVLKERFRRSVACSDVSKRHRGGVLVREVVAPYEAAVEELKMNVKAKEVEVENLKEKLKTLTNLTTNVKKRSQSRRKVSCSQVTVAPGPELFEATMIRVNETSKSFTSLLLSLMRSAQWDIAAAVRSIESATTDSTTTSITSIHHAKYALESYISRKVFESFDHETFYMDGSLSSLLHPDQFRRDCFTQYRDMKSMDPVELLGILPTCQFGKFCTKKYLSIVHPKMEESLFGNLDQSRQVMAGNHPRSQFYSEFLGLAKAVWLLHLLAFSLDPAPSHFQVSPGAEFHPQYMESVVKFGGGRVPAGQIVGFSISPGFKLWNGSVIKARVYLVSKK